MKSRPTPNEWSHRATSAVNRHIWHRYKHHPVSTTLFWTYLVSVFWVSWEFYNEAVSSGNIVLAVAYSLPGVEYFFACYVIGGDPRDYWFNSRQYGHDVRYCNKHPLTVQKCIRFVKKYWIAHAIIYYVIIMIVWILVTYK